MGNGGEAEDDEQYRGYYSDYNAWLHAGLGTDALLPISTVGATGFVEAGDAEGGNAASVAFEVGTFSELGGEGAGEPMVAGAALDDVGRGHVHGAALNALTLGTDHPRVAERQRHSGGLDLPALAKTAFVLFVSDRDGRRFGWDGTPKQNREVGLQRIERMRQGQAEVRANGIGTDAGICVVGWGCRFTQKIGLFDRAKATWAVLEAYKDGRAAVTTDSIKHWRPPFKT